MNIWGVYKREASGWMLVRRESANGRRKVLAFPDCAKASDAANELWNKTGIEHCANTHHERM